MAGAADLLVPLEALGVEAVGHAVVGVLIAHRVVPVAVGDAAGHHLVVHRHHEDTALHLQKELDRLQHLHRLLRQTAVQVVDEEDEVETLRVVRAVAAGELLHVVVEVVVPRHQLFDG